MYQYGLLIGILGLAFGTYAIAEELSLYTSQDTYYYGEHLSFTIKVSEVTENTATLYIIDEEGKSSSPIRLAITNQTTTNTSPFPFESSVYPQGTYTMKIMYSGQETATQFTLKDDGRIVIPIGIKEIGARWAGGSATDSTFASSIRFLATNGIIMIPEITQDMPASKVIIPEWFKINTIWWIQGLITDDDFAGGLQFLIEKGIMVV